MERLVFRYLTGSKANQIEQVPLEGVIELMVGRDPNASIVFDPEKDDLVSRQHAVIRVKDTVKLSFTVADLQSTNGTFLNGERILAEQELLPGDSIEFGKGGPKMVFDVEPRPAHLVERTRIISNAAFKETKMSDGAPATSVHAAGASATMVGSGSTAVPPKAGIGMQTLERELAKERKSSGQKWMIGAAAALVIVGLVGGLLYFRNVQTETALKEQVAAAERKAAAQVAEVKSQVNVMTPKQIAAEFGDATVFIKSSWTLYDKRSGKQVYQKTILYGGENGIVGDRDDGLLPAYVRLDSGEVVRWLVTVSEDQTDGPIGVASATGSGFVVTPDGSILTNKHVGAEWMMPWQDDFGSAGIVLPVNEPVYVRKSKNSPVVLNSKARLVQVRDLVAGEQLRPWIPAPPFPVNPPPIFDGDRPSVVADGLFEAKYDMTVTFPGTNLGVAARFLRASDKNDAALIKIDVPGNTPVKTVELAPKGFQPAIGEPVTVMGYPGLSGNRVTLTSSRELGSREASLAVVPEPTVTEGIIAKLVEREAQGADLSRILGRGDFYLLTINSTGHGNSGGPVFDSNGKVIGLFTYGIPGVQGEQASASAAVPIKFGQELLQLTRVVTDH
jgi:FOG: FHA domain